MKVIINFLDNSDEEISIFVRVLNKIKNESESNNISALDMGYLNKAIKKIESVKEIE